MFLCVGQTPHLGQFLLTSSSAVCTASGWSLFHIFMLLESSLGVAEKAVMALGRLLREGKHERPRSALAFCPFIPQGQSQSQAVPWPPSLKGRGWRSKDMSHQWLQPGRAECRQLRPGCCVCCDGWQGGTRVYPRLWIKFSSHISVTQKKKVGWNLGDTHHVYYRWPLLLSSH